MSRLPLTDDVTWLAECTPVDGRHLHIAAYLVEAANGSVLVDTGSHRHREAIISAVADATDGRGVEAVLLTHFDLPHSGNVRAVQREWPAVEVMVGLPSPEVHGYPGANHWRWGESMTVGGRTFDFIDPPIADVAHTSWIFDRGSGVLFTADGFGGFHEAGRCRDWIEREADLPDADAVVDYHADTIPWAAYVDTAVLREELDVVVEAFPVEYVAPTHGPPIPAEFVEPYVDRLLAGIETGMRAPGP